MKKGKVVRCITAKVFCKTEEIANELFDYLESEFAKADWEMDFGDEEDEYSFRGAELGTFEFYNETRWEPSYWEDDLEISRDEVKNAVMLFSNQHEDYGIADWDIDSSEDIVDGGW